MDNSLQQGKWWTLHILWRTRKPLIHHPFQHVEGHGSVLEDDVVELSHVELVALFLFGLRADFFDFEFADFAGEGLPDDDSERQLLDVVLPVRWLSGFGDQFQIFDVLTNGASQLVAEYQAREWTRLPLPVFRQRAESDVLCEKDSL